MKKPNLFFTAAFTVGLLSVQVFAVTAASTTPAPAATGDRPVLVSMVNPTNLPQRHACATVRLAFTVDEHGRPRNINLLSPADPVLSENLLPSIAQWRFTPAYKNGVAVATRVLLPLTRGDQALSSESPGR